MYPRITAEQYAADRHQWGEMFMTYDRHPATGKEVGRFERSMGHPYWHGPCACGSGREGKAVYDDHNIYFGISCSACNRQPAPGPYDEQIEED